MRVLLAVLVGAVALQAASGAQLRASGEIRAAFSKDGFDVVQEAQFQGARGFVAHARNASNLKTGKPKAALYVEGNSYAMGYLTGLLRPDEVTAMATTFVSHCPIHMLSRDIDWEMWHSNNTLAKALYNVRGGEAPPPPSPALTRAPFRPPAPDRGGYAWRLHH